MIVGIIGSGGREHAICCKIRDPQKLVKYFVFLAMLAQVILLRT